MSLQRHMRSVDGTIPVPALLYDDEELLDSQDGVGIYDGLQKSPEHQNGTITITSHRIFYINAQKARSRSFALDLSLVARTEYYAGLFTSSPKVTLHLACPTLSSPSNDDPADESWTCEVCNYRNPPGLSPANKKCGLCGVPRSKSDTSSPAPILASNSRMSSANHLPASLPPSPPPESPKEIACPACTFFNNSSLTACEICGTQLPRSRLSSKSAPASRPTSPQPDEKGDNKIMKLSFRKGGDKAFYATLKRSLLGKAWEDKAQTAAVQTAGTDRFGIDGLIRNVQTSAQTRSTDMSAALQDLEALMIKAREMVRLAHDLNDRLTASSALAAPPSATPSQSSSSFSTTATLVNEPEAATFVRTSLAQLGLQMQSTPVTLDMLRDETRWHDELARELAGLLQGTPGPGSNTADQRGLMRARGTLGLDEVWGGWNRARGIALIPPATFLQVLPHLPAHTDPPIHARTLAGSGLRVLHTPAFAPAAFAARLAARIGAAGPRTTLEVAWAEDVPVGLVAEMVAEAEGAGVVCRDESQGGAAGFGEGGGEVRWWCNVFADYVWDGQE